MKQFSMKEFLKHKDPKGPKATYNIATGWLSVTWPEKPSRNVLNQIKGQGFRYKPSIKTWKAKWTVGREDTLKNIGADIQKVEIDIDYDKRAAFKLGQAAKHRKKASEHFGKADSIMKMIPMGQPILVGHHSERRHRSDLRKHERSTKKGVEHYDKAKHLEYQAARQGENPITVLNRIEKLESEERKHIQSIAEVQMIEQQYGDKIPAPLYNRMPSKTYHTRSLEKVQERLKHEREKYDKMGGIPADKIQFKKGMRIQTRYGGATVTRVNPKTLRVKYDAPNLSGFTKLDKKYVIGVEKISIKKDYRGPEAAMEERAGIR